MFDIGDRVQIVAYNAGDAPPEFLNFFKPPLTIEEAAELLTTSVVGRKGVVFDIYKVPEFDQQAAAAEINVPVGELAYAVLFDDESDILADYNYKGKQLQYPVRLERFELFTAVELVKLQDIN